MNDDKTPPEDLGTTEIESSGSDSDLQVGPYRLLQKIGEGGMGEVWLAQQDKPVRRRVAVKLIKLGMDTKQVCHGHERHLHSSLLRARTLS